MRTSIRDITRRPLVQRDTRANQAIAQTRHHLTITSPLVNPVCQPIPQPAEPAVRPFLKISCLATAAFFASMVYAQDNKPGMTDFKPGGAGDRCGLSGGRQRRRALTRKMRKGLWHDCRRAATGLRHGGAGQIQFAAAQGEERLWERLREHRPSASRTPVSQGGSMPFFRLVAAAAGESMKLSSARVTITFWLVTAMPAENMVRL